MSLDERIRAGLSRTTPPSRKTRAVYFLLLAAFLTGPLLSHLHKSLRRDHGDWLSIYNIALHSVQTGRLEADETEPIVRTQRYPPIARPVLMVLAVVPKPVSAVASFFLFAGLYGWCAWRLSGALWGTTGEGRWFGTALLLVLVSPYVWADLTAGNLTSVLLWSVTAAYFGSAAGRPWRAGLALSVGILLKMIPVLCLAYFLLRRQWRVGWGVLIGVVVIGVLPSLILFGAGPLADYHAYWYREEFIKFTPLATIDRPVECLYQNQAVVRTLVRLFTPTNAGHSTAPFFIQMAEPPRWVIKSIYVLLMGASLAALATVLWRSRRASSSEGARYSLCTGAMLWFSPWVASYYFSLMMWPVAALLAATLRDGSRNLRVVKVAMGIWLLSMPALGSQWLRAWGVNLWSAALLLMLTGSITMVNCRTRRSW